MHVHRLLPVAVLVLALAGCGGDDEAPAPVDPSTTVPVEPSASASPSGGSGLPGVAANADVTDLLCARDSAGTWRATGAITNPTKAPADYRVTVVVGAPDAGQKQARRLVLPRLQPAAPTAFTVDEIPVGESATPTCRVQVVRLR